MSCTRENCQCKSEQIHTQDAISDLGHANWHIEELEEALSTVQRERAEYLKERNELIIGLFEMGKEKDVVALAWMNESTERSEARKELKLLKRESQISAMQATERITELEFALHGELTEQEKMKEATSKYQANEESEAEETAALVAEVGEQLALDIDKAMRQSTQGGLSSQQLSSESESNESDLRRRIPDPGLPPALR